MYSDIPQWMLLHAQGFLRMKSRFSTSEPGILVASWTGLTLSLLDMAVLTITVLRHLTAVAKLRTTCATIFVILVLLVYILMVDCLLNSHCHCGGSHRHYCLDDLVCSSWSYCDASGATSNFEVLRGMLSLL